MIEGAPPAGERRAAQHCEELLSNTLDAIDVAGDFARFATRLARALQSPLASLFDCHKLETQLVECTCSPAATLGETLASALGGTMHHARFALLGKGLGVMASAPVAGLIAEFDRMLGGDGEAADDAQALPSSADRFSRQIEGELLNACIEASGRADLAGAERGSTLGDIVPHAARAPVHVATIALARPNTAKLMLTFAVCEETFVQFPGEVPVGRPVRRSIGEMGIENSAVSQVELPTTATLVDMAIPLHRIVALQPGAMLPVTIHRAVPLSIGDTIIAHGTVGMLEERVALEIHCTAFARNSLS